MRIDLHAHVCPPGLAAAWEREASGAPRPSQGPRQLEAAMRDMAVDAAVVSGPAIPAGSRRLARANNEALAELVRDRPGRLGALATLPQPDVAASLDELAFALDDLGLDGVRLQTSAGGVYASDRRFAEVFEELDRRGAYVHLHPAPPAHAPSHPYPSWAFDYPHETTRTVAELLFTGTLTRLRAIRMQLSHLGGTIPFLADRLRAVEVREPELVEPAGVDVRAELARLYYDTAQAAAPGPLALVADLAGADHIVLGTDWPFDPLADPAVDSGGALALVPRLAERIAQ